MGNKEKPKISKITNEDIKLATDVLSNQELSEDEVKKSTWRIEVIDLFEYRGIRVLVRHIPGTTDARQRTYGSYFEYMFMFNDEFYSDNLQFTPEEGRSELTKNQIKNAAGIAATAATATIDILMGEDFSSLDKGGVEAQAA